MGGLLGAKGYVALPPNSKIIVGACPPPPSLPSPVLCRINKNYPKLSPNTPSYLELYKGNEIFREGRLSLPPSQNL